MDFAIPGDRSVETRENEKIDKYLDFARELKDRQIHGPCRRTKKDIQIHGYCQRIRKDRQILGPCRTIKKDRQILGPCRRTRKDRQIHGPRRRTKKLWNMRVKIMPILDGALEMVSKDLEKEL